MNKMLMLMILTAVFGAFACRPRSETSEAKEVLLDNKYLLFSDGKGSERPTKVSLWEFGSNVPGDLIDSGHPELVVRKKDFTIDEVEDVFFKEGASPAFIARTITFLPKHGETKRSVEGSKACDPKIVVCDVSSKATASDPDSVWYKYIIRPLMVRAGWVLPAPRPQPPADVSIYRNYSSQSSNQEDKNAGTSWKIQCNFDQQRNGYPGVLSEGAEPLLIEGPEVTYYGTKKEAIGDAMRAGCDRCSNYSLIARRLVYMSPGSFNRAKYEGCSLVDCYDKKSGETVTSEGPALGILKAECQK